MPNASKITHLIAYGFYLLCTATARLLPLKLVFVMGQWLGQIGYYLLWNRRRVAIENLQLALGKTGEEARILARDHFINVGSNMLSAVKIATMSEEQIRTCVTVTIPEELKGNVLERQEKPEGWVAMISHMGNWELFSHITSFAPHYKYGAIYHKLANDYVDRHFRETRAKSGVTLFDRREGYLKCVSFIREGGSVGVLVDQYAGIPGTWMPFFNRLTSTSTLAATLAKRAGARIYPIAINTVGIARWHIIASLPIPDDENTEVLTARINAELERQIKASPADWLWAHNRWKTPRWGFLFTRSGRRIFYPPGFDAGKLIPYRMLVRSADELEEAKASVPAMQAIKEGRPDAMVTVLANEATGEFWKGITGVDEVIIAAPGDSVKDVAKKIQACGRFDVGVLFSPERRAALELYHGGVPYRFGPPYRFLLNSWKNPPGLKDPPASGAERYNRIALDMGAVVIPGPGLE